MKGEARWSGYWVRIYGHQELRTSNEMSTPPSILSWIDVCVYVDQVWQAPWKQLRGFAKLFLVNPPNAIAQFSTPDLVKAVMT